MKGFVLTLDALFALIIAVSAISMILYFNFSYQAPYLIRPSEAASVMQGLASTNVSSLSSGFAIPQYANQYTGSNATWFQSMSDYGGSGYSQAGPLQPTLAYLITLPKPVSSQVLGGYGMIYFSAANTIYAYNATGGTFSWSTLSPTVITGIILYRNTVIYTNSTSIVSISAFNGNQLWSSTLPLSPNMGAVSTPLKEYDGQIVFGASSGYIAGFSPINGSMIWNSSNIGSTPISVATDGGSFAVLTNSEITLLASFHSYAAQVWTDAASGTQSNGIASYDGAIILGSGSAANALFVNGVAEGSQIPIGGQIYGVAGGNGYFVYQAKHNVSAVTDQGDTLAWSDKIPNYFGGASSAMPVIGNNTIYSLWSNGYIYAHSLQNGTVFWSTQLPYPGPYSFLSLAYGNLYAVAGNTIAAIGQCPVQHGSVLYAASQLYINGYTGCADYLVDSVYPMNNYTIMIGNSTAPDISVLNLTGSSYAYIKPNNSVDTNAYTWSVWIKPNAWVGGDAGIMGQNSVSSGSPYLVEQGTSASPSLTFSNNDGSSSGYTLAVSNSVSSTGWQNVAVTYDYISGTITMYIDGQKQGSARNAATLPDTNGPIYIGYMPAVSSYGFNGLVANLQTYNESLSQVQVYQIYSAGIAGAPLQNADLTGWYPMGGNANDYSGLGNTGYTVGGRYSSANFTPQGMLNSFEVSRATAPVGLYNYSTGESKIYGVSVVSWR